MTALPVTNIIKVAVPFLQYKLEIRSDLNFGIVYQSKQDDWKYYTYNISSYGR